MAVRRLATADHPFVVRVVLQTFAWLASLEFAVVILTALAVVLGVGTFVESGFGTEAVKFAVWNTWWFTLLNALLAVSIFSAAAIRYPWKRHQTGFVITHIGLLVLLAGCLISQRGGIDAQIPLFEGDTGRRAYEDSLHFSLTLGDREGRPLQAEPVEISFRTGPFNWSEYRTDRWWFPWKLAARDSGVLFDRDGIRLEVLDYFADSTAALAPSLNLEIGSDAFGAASGSGSSVWMPVELAWQPDPLRGGRMRHRQSAGGGTVVFWKARSRPEAEAFLSGLPDSSLGFGSQGQLVLVAEGRVYRRLVEETHGVGWQPLDDSGLEIEVTEFEERLSSLRLRVRRVGSESAEEMVVLADLPEVSIHAPRSGVYGSLWIERSVKDAAERMQGKAGSRIDILQVEAPFSAARDAVAVPAATGDGEFLLLYRRWQQAAVTAGLLPADGGSVPAFEMPMAKLRMRVQRFLPAQELSMVTLPLPFTKDKPPTAKRRAAQVRLTLDGTSETFWLAGIPISPLDEPPGAAERHTVTSRTRSITTTLAPDAVDVGFEIALENFERRLDPGTSQASHFSSLVTFQDDAGKALVTAPVTITMNAPVDFSDPASGRSYRLFQESFMGPWLPGDDLYDRMTKEMSDRPERLEASVLTVNYDPGRGVKYAGSGLIVIGIFTMFYMRAYFFGSRPGRAGSARSPASTELLPA